MPGTAKFLDNHTDEGKQWRIGERNYKVGPLAAKPVPERACEETQVSTHASCDAARDPRVFQPGDSNRRPWRTIGSTVICGSADYVDSLARSYQMLRQIAQKLASGSGIRPEKLIQK
jgi:hypothetical protein